MKILMHVYHCPSCRFHWRQQVPNEKESCISCQFFPVPRGEAVERDVAPLAAKHARRKLSLPFYILDGHIPVPEPDPEAWALSMDSADNTVAQTQLGPSLVSTVFLGFNHRLFGPGEPLLFETMVFTDGKPEDFQERCSTWLEAETQHAIAVNEVARRYTKLGGLPLATPVAAPMTAAERQKRNQRRRENEVRKAKRWAKKQNSPGRKSAAEKNPGEN